MDVRDPELLEAVFSHLVLPPKLPQSCDAENLDLLQAFGSRLQRACDTLQKIFPDDHVWKDVEKTIGLASTLNDQGSLAEPDVLNALQSFSKGNSKPWLVFHVSAQNASLLVYHDSSGQNMIFEAFRTAAPTSVVLGATYALEWQFPTRAASVPFDEFESPSFQHNLATFLEQASNESYDYFAARGHKAKISIAETRDVSNPTLVLEMLMSLLEGVGTSVKFEPTVKHVRDDIVLGQSETPWRRSPYWLTLRVALQRQFSEKLGASGRVYFKFLLCVVLVNLLRDSTFNIHPEKSLMIQAKLCRRLAKLESERCSSSKDLRTTYDKLFTETTSMLESTISSEKARIRKWWKDYSVSRNFRLIPRLPRKVSLADHKLALRNSLGFLLSLLSQVSGKNNGKGLNTQPTSLWDATICQVDGLGDCYAGIMNIENAARDEMLRSRKSQDYPQRCMKLSEKIIYYRAEVGDKYTGDAQLMSKHLLLLFELWVAMDKAAVSACPTLKLYHPYLCPEALDVLCLFTKSEMARLQAVQVYLHNRIEERTHSEDIFRNSSFPLTILTNAPEGSAILQAEDAISSRDEVLKKAKVRELDAANAKYDTLTQKMQQEVCSCINIPKRPKVRDRCLRCQHKRARKKIKINIYEALLPMENAQRAAILHELAAPEYLAMYRLATWTLIMLGTLPSAVEPQHPVLFLSEFNGIVKLARSNCTSTGLTLASRKKSFSQTHYKKQKMPKRPNEVIFPFGPQFVYYDTKYGCWADELPIMPWYQHLLGPWMPPGIPDPYQDLPGPSDDFEAALAPSSYEIAASVTRCPPDMSIHEFSALQRLSSGRSRRWPVLLAELGATNLNFGSETTMKLVNHVALQAGMNPWYEGDGDLRESHSIFKSTEFCEQLHKQLDHRLRAIASSWREVNCMSTIIVLTLRLYYLASNDCKPLARQLLSKVRNVTTDWILRLGNETRTTPDADAAGRASTYALWASLLCRQTFVIYQDINEPVTDLGRFFCASIALQQNLTVSIGELPPLLKSMLTRDVIMARSMWNIIPKWAQSDFTSLEEAIDETWDTGATEQRVYSPWKLLSGKARYWVLSVVAEGKDAMHQTVHFHLLHGYLMIDGRPFGQLPAQMRESPGIKELFPNKNLLTCPSNMRGMQYQLVNSIQYNKVHFGLRGHDVIIKTRFRGQTFEYVPRNVFYGESGMDFPADLVENCVHWLNLHTRKLEIRRKPVIWIPKPNHWTLDIDTQIAIRNQGVIKNGVPRPGSGLIDSRSQIAKSIVSVFRGFEQEERLTIYRPMDQIGTIWVEMKRLELRFFVNGQGLLQSQQLNAEIDPNQEIGTWHGLQSYIVVRHIRNNNRRSVLVPISDSFSWKALQIHANVHIPNVGVYARFGIDETLGRITCHPEPSLQYLKAAIHAVTSSFLPDKLTGRTGIEEAKQILLSARSQPWSPLGLLPQSLLQFLKSLAPKRCYYPPTMRAYQRVSWDENLTMTVQHEALAAAAESILQQSQQLQTFNSKDGVNDSIAQCGEVEYEHLDLRSLLRRQTYERLDHPSDAAILDKLAKYTPYSPDQTSHESNQSCRVYGIVKEISNPSKRFMLEDIADILESWGSFQGFGSSIPRLNIQDILTNEISLSWGSYVQICRQQPSAKYDSLFTLSLLALREDMDKKVLFWLATIAQDKNLKAIDVPQHPFFDIFTSRLYPDMKIMVDVVEASQLCYRDYHVQKKNYNPREADAAYWRGGHSLQSWEDLKVDEAQRIALRLLRLYPRMPKSLRELNNIFSDESFEFTDTGRLWTKVDASIKSLHRNVDLSSYLFTLQDFGKSQATWKMGMHVTKAKPSHPPTFATPRKSPQFRVPFLKDMVRQATITARPPMATTGTGMSNALVPMLKGMVRQATIAANAPMAAFGTGMSNAFNFQLTASRAAFNTPPEVTALEEIVNEFLTSPKKTRHKYASDLQTSIKALVKERQQNSLLPRRLGRQDDIADLKASVNETPYRLNSIKMALEEGKTYYSWLEKGDLLPCMHPIAILEQLRHDNSSNLGPGVKEALVSYGVLVTKLQRYWRTNHAYFCSDERQLLDEQKHEGHTNWEPIDHPDWLLLEIDNDILIRPMQVEVASAIISPESKANSVLQMNMGQGKTSCIMPMAVAMLADGTKLCRVIVPKALLLQTAQIIQSRLGGLVGRSVRHIPFERRSPTTSDSLSLYQDLHQHTLQHGGVMLCLPENILSFRLSGLQKLSDGLMATATSMVNIQRWLDKSCRDILDESDFILSPKTQLIYPLGSPITVDGHPHRWHVIEDVLSLVERQIPTLQRDFGSDIEVIRRHQGYPIIHLLNPAVEDALNGLLANEICEGELARLPLKDNVPIAAQETIRRIVTGENVPQSSWDIAFEYLADDVFGRKALYLLRGLIGQRILALCLAKIWNVQYGLHPDRAPMAVPYEAKGVPSATSEYGHPDTALVLTCLAFYQTGMNEKQLGQALKHVMRSDDPAMNWERLVSGCNLPITLRHWNMINTEDETQMTQLCKYLRFEANMLNYFMNHFVFPLHAKQFSLKLEASGWDIPLATTNKVRTLTTGFSGTNDNKHLLPSTIRQDDLPSLMQTNAEVLSYLLEPRNRTCYQAVNADGKHLTEEGLLWLLNSNSIRILIDAGAHILEMENRDLAEAWLLINHDADGAVYFDKQSRIMVRARFQKDPMPLLASPFAENLDKCVVYIDQQHTRGIDLKLPVKARGAVTLGLGQTKDQTVQAAMRLRQLGSTQSITFIASPEVYRSIRSLQPRKTGCGEVNSADVVRWLLEQSCVANESMMPLRLSQGTDYCNRVNALWKNSQFLSVEKQAKHLLGTIQQKEEQTLEQLYGPSPKIAESSLVPSKVLHRLIPILKSLEQDRADLNQRGELTRLTTFEEVEQEREIEFEVEHMRESQKPEYLEPLSFPGFDGWINDFIETGVLHESAFVQAFEFIGTTIIGKRYGVGKTSSKLFVSSEFTKTVVKSRHNPGQEVIRPIEWVFWSPSTQTALVLIPEEAEPYMSVLSNEEDPHVWLLTYAAPVTKSMQVFNSLTYLTMPSRKKLPPFPPWLAIELSVLAGGLYFEYHQYKPLLDWLGVDKTPLSPCGLPIRRPLKFLLDWLTHRRQTQDILHTPMGFVCQHRPLNGHHSFFAMEAEVDDVTALFAQKRIYDGPIDEKDGDNYSSNEE